MRGAATTMAKLPQCVGLLSVVCLTLLTIVRADPARPAPPTEYTAHGFYEAKFQAGFFHNYSFVEFYSTEQKVQKLYVAERGTVTLLYRFLPLASATPSRCTPRSRTCWFSMLTGTSSSRPRTASAASTRGTGSTTGSFFLVQASGHTLFLVNHLPFSSPVYHVLESLWATKY